MLLVAGIVSSFSHCVLSTIPLVVGYVGGYAGKDKKLAFKYSLFFCIGLVITFTVFGALSAILGRLMTGTGKWWYIVLGIIMLIAGLQGMSKFMPC
jgi:Cytochrome c biogenesis protein